MGDEAVTLVWLFSITIGILEKGWILVMGKITEYIGSQFGDPRGVIGKCCCIYKRIKGISENMLLLRNVQKWVVYSV